MSYSAVPFETGQGFVGSQCKKWRPKAYGFLFRDLFNEHFGFTFCGLNTFFKNFLLFELFRLSAVVYQRFLN